MQPPEQRAISYSHATTPEHTHRDQRIINEYCQAHNIDLTEQYPQSDSNRQHTDFKSVASANWAMGAQQSGVCSVQYYPIQPHYPGHPSLLPFPHVREWSH